MLRSRLAPTPSGYLHIGNALNFVLTWLMVRNENGSLQLRIDDLDAPRLRPEFLEDIFRTLDWLGLDWDEGPQSPDEQYRIFSQQLRLEKYNALLGELIDTGKVFSCGCSRKEIREQNMEGQYPGNCKKKALPLSQPDSALRLLTPPETIIMVQDFKAGELPMDLYEVIRDPVMRRRDGIPAYHIASLADDLDFGINLIVRGMDLLPSTALQLYMAKLLNAIPFLETQFYHHPIINSADGHKLSKSAGSDSLKDWRERGEQPERFYLWLSEVLGWEEKVVSAREMLEVVESGNETILK